MYRKKYKIPGLNNPKPTAEEKQTYKDGLQPVLWKDVKLGQIVYLDNYRDGQFPEADPLKSGPYEVVELEHRRLERNPPFGPEYDPRCNACFMCYAEILLQAVQDTGQATDEAK